MGYEIIYDRRFIFVVIDGENKYIPIFQYGSNNCFDFASNGRMIPEKNWGVLNYTKRNQYLFNESEIRELAAIYENSGEIHKSRYKIFDKGEFERWYINGMKSAKPLEYYTELGNAFHILDYTDYVYNEKEPERHYIKTTEELLAKLKELDGKELTMGFVPRNLYLPRKRKQYKERKKVSQYFVLYNSKTGYLHKLTRNGYRYSPYSVSNAKKFITEKQIKSYLQKYEQRLDGFEIEQINEIAYI